MKAEHAKCLLCFCALRKTPYNTPRQLNFARRVGSFSKWHEVVKAGGRMGYAAMPRVSSVAARCAHECGLVSGRIHARLCGLCQRLLLSLRLPSVFGEGGDSAG